MGEPFEVAVCLNCSQPINHVYWGNGGNHWEHENGSHECHSTPLAKPTPGTIDEIVNDS